MAHRAVETLLGRLATDPDLLHRFERDPGAVVAEFEEQGHDLTPVEREALVGTDAAAIAALTRVLDRRIRKAESARPAVGASPAEPNRATPHRLTAKRQRKRRGKRPTPDRVRG